MINCATFCNDIKAIKDMIVHVLISEMVGYIHAEQMESRNHTDYSRFLFVIYDKKLCADQLICGN